MKNNMIKMGLVSPMFIFGLSLCSMIIASPLRPTSEKVTNSKPQPSYDKPMLRINRLDNRGMVIADGSYLRRFDPKIFPYLDTYKVGIINMRYRNLLAKGKSPHVDALYVQGKSMFYIHENPLVHRTLVFFAGVNGLVGAGPAGAPDDFELMFRYAKEHNYNLLLVDAYGHNINFDESQALHPLQDAQAFWRLYQTASGYIHTLRDDRSFSYRRCTAVIDAYLNHLKKIRSKRQQSLEVVAVSFGGVALQRMLVSKKYSRMITKCTFIAPLLLDLRPDYRSRNVNTQIDFVIGDNDLVLAVGRNAIRSKAAEQREVMILRRLGLKVRCLQFNTNDHVYVCKISKNLYDLDAIFKNEYELNEDPKKQ